MYSYLPLLPVVLSLHLPVPGTVSEPHTPASPLSPASLLSSVDIVVEDEEDEVKEKESELSKALTYCPALKFVTRKDLFSFLSSAGVSVWVVCVWVWVWVGGWVGGCGCGWVGGV